MIHVEMPKGGSDKKRSEINLEDLLCFKGYVVEQTTSKLSQFINLSKAFFFHSTGLMEEKNIYERYFRHYLHSEKVKRGPPLFSWLIDNNTPLSMFTSFLKKPEKVVEFLHGEPFGLVLVYMHVKMCVLLRYAARKSV